MKITLNLAVAPTFRERYALAWSVPATLVALAVMAGLAYSSLGAFRAYRKAQADLLGPERQERELTAREAELRRSLERPEFRSTLREAQFVNSLIERKRLSLSALTIKVAGLLPPDARLSAMALTRADRDSVVRFEVTGKTAQAVETFLSNLTNSPDFEDPTITSEGSEQGSTGSATILACTARYIGARDNAEQPAGSSSQAPGAKTAGGN